MGSFPREEPESCFSFQNTTNSTNPDDETLENQCGLKLEVDEWAKIKKNSEKTNKKKVKSKSKKKNQVLLAVADEDDLTRTKSLTDEDLEELKGCLDLGFGFSYDEIPELSNTLPALELCYSMSQKFMDENYKSPEYSDAASPAPEQDACSSVSSPIASWRISSPGDDPDDVKARLKLWATAVACTVRLCS